MTERRIVVTGLGAITPLGNSVTEFWNNLIQGVSGADMITKFDASKFKTRFACEVKGFDPSEYIDKKELRKMDPFTHYAIAAAQQAVDDAQLTEGSYNPDRVGVIWGSGIGGLFTFQNECIAFAQGRRNPTFQSIFHSKNDFRYRSRTHFHAIRISRTQFCYRFRMRLCHQCPT